MSHKDNAALQHWDCDKCSQTYNSPVALNWPPQHRCGGQHARTLKDFKLKEVKA